MAAQRMTSLETALYRLHDHGFTVVALVEQAARNVEEARASVRLIEERGFARGRDLSAGLESLLAGRGD